MTDRHKDRHARRLPETLNERGRHDDVYRSRNRGRQERCRQKTNTDIGGRQNGRLGQRGSRASIYAHQTYSCQEAVAEDKRGGYAEVTGRVAHKPNARIARRWGFRVVVSLQCPHLLTPLVSCIATPLISRVASVYGCDKIFTP